MRKFYLFMLMAVGLLISTSMSAMPERPVPPTEPQDVAEGVLKKEVPPTVPTSFTAAPHKAAMDGNVATIIRDGVETPYTDWATMMDNVQDGDEIRLEANHVGTITLNKNVTLNLNGNTIDCSASTYKGIIINVQADVTIKDGTIKANYSNDCYGIVVNANYSATIEDVLMKSQYTDGYGWGQYGVSYCVYVYADGSATIKGSSKLDGYYEAVYNIGTSTIEGNIEAYAKQYGVYNKGTLNIKENAKVTSVYHSICNYANVNIYGGTLTSSSYQGIYNYTNGAEITVKGGSIIGNNYGIYDAAGASITVNGGKIEGKNYYAIYSATNGSLEMSAGELVGASYGVIFQSATSVSVSGGSITGNGACGLYTNQTNTTLTGGRFKGTGNPDIYCYGGEISIKGGEYTRNDFEVDKGYAFASQDDPTYKYKVVASVAHIGGTIYGSLTDALTAAQAGDEVVVDNDITGDYTISKAITLNTGKNTISGTITADGVKVMVKGTGTINALAVANEGTFEIYSGTYPFNPAQYLAENISAMDNHDGTYTAGLFLARIGEDKFFFTFQEALDAVPENGTEPTEVVVLQDIDNTVEIYICGHRKMILNLNGHTLNMLGSTSINVSKDGSDASYVPSAEDMFAVKNGIVNAPDGGCTFYGYGGVITVENVTLNNSSSYTLYAYSGEPVFNIKEGTVINAPCYCNSGIFNMDAGTNNNYMYVTAGTFNMNGGTINNFVYLTAGTFNMYGGIVSNEADSYTVRASGETTKVNIYNGTIVNSYDNEVSYAIYMENKSQLSISGGFINSENGGYELGLMGVYAVFTGGTCAHNVSELPMGYAFQKNANGTYDIKRSVASIKGSDVVYSTLASAVADASENAWIYLTSNFEEAEVRIDKSVTLYTAVDTIPVTLTGKVVATNGATVTIQGKGTITDFEEDGGEIKIVSGTFPKDPSDYLAERSMIVEGTTYTVVSTVARVEENQSTTKYFYDLKSAFDYVQNLEGDNYVIDILDNFEFKVDNGRYITLNKGKKITLNLNGHHVHGIMDAHETITSWAEMIYVTNGHFIVEDLSGDETGIMSFEQINPEPKTWYGNYMINVQSGATFTLKSGTLTNNTKHSTFAIAVSVEIENGGTANIEGGKILGVYSTSCIRTYSNGTLNISGGYFSATAYHMIFIQQHSTTPIIVNITGGEFEHLGGGHAISCYATDGGQLTNTSVNISGGKFDSRVIGFYLENEHSYWGGTAWKRDDWNALYRNLFHATGGQFAVDIFSIEGTDVDGNSFVHKPSLAEILDPEYDLFEQDNEDYPYYVGPKEITESTGDGNWNDLFPDSEKKNIQIEHQVTVIEGYTTAYSLNVQPTGEVIVKQDATLDLTWGLVMEDGASMTVEPGGTLKVGVAGIQNTSNSRIVVQTDPNNSSIITFNPDAFLFSDPYISVEYTTSAYKSTDNGFTWYKWQDIGIPTRKAPNFVRVEATTAIMRWNVQSGEYEDVIPETFNEPFRGYIITNKLSAPGYTYIMNGRMNAAENQTLKFNVSAESGKESFNFFANSFLTPMDIKTFLQGLSDEDENIERTVHVFNSESDSYESVALSSIKYGSADFTTIAPMQGFYMSTTSNVEASATLNYRNSIWGQTSTEPIHAPQSIESDLNMFNLYAGTGKAKDKLSFFESGIFTAEYENGYDAVKYMNKDFNIFVATERGKQSIVATDLLEGTVLTFQAGDAIEYQLSFDKVQCDEYSIVDLMTGSITEVGEGNTYNFVAEPKSTEERFQIIRKTPWVATGVDEVAEKTYSKGVYTILGQYVGSSADWNKLSTGVYIVDGVKIVK